MRKIFISYAHLDKQWVNNLVDELHIRSGYDIWLDGRLRGGSNWWERILEEIEGCDYFVHVGTINSYNSIYCREEVKYAFNLNKPILPLILHQGSRLIAQDEEAKLNISEIEDSILEAIEKTFQDVDLADDFNTIQRLTFYMNDDFTTRIRFDMEQALCKLRVDSAMGKYELPPQYRRPTRPPIPFPKAEDANIFAEDAYQKGEYRRAKGMFKIVVQSNLSLRKREHAESRLHEINHILARIKSYEKIKEAINISKTDTKYARLLWQEYIDDYYAGSSSMVNIDFDDIETLLARKEQDIISGQEETLEEKLFNADLDTDEDED